MSTEETDQKDLADGGLAETERLHAAACRAQEAQRTREAEILQAGFESGHSSAADTLTALRASLAAAEQEIEQLKTELATRVDGLS